MIKINKKVVAGIPCKDEELIIAKNLKALSTFCHKIIIVDDGSTDKTEEICKSFPKVEFYKRVKTNKNNNLREDGIQRQMILTHMAKHNPDYCLFLDADEIPSPDIVQFINTINPKINLWKLPWIHLWKDDQHYRIDKYKTPTNINVNWHPFKGGQRKGNLMKFDKNINYQYVKNKPCSVPMEPKNVPLPHSTTEKTRIVHWGKISEVYKSGEHDKIYAEVRAKFYKMNLNQRIQHHTDCRSEKTLKLAKVEKGWHWD